MASLFSIAPFIPILNYNPVHCSRIYSSFPIVKSTVNFPSRVDLGSISGHLRFSSGQRFGSNSNLSPIDEEEGEEGLVEVLRVPENWLDPSKALEESEWLRVALHKWLDDEYCPEATNVEISNVAAQSYYKSLVEKQTDLGEILLKMATELESISYQESFHGAFSSANAAISLIIQRLEWD